MHVFISLRSHALAFNWALALLGLSSAVAFALVLGCMILTSMLAVEVNLGTVSIFGSVN